MESPAQPNNPSQLPTHDLLATQQLLRATLDASRDMIQVFEAVRNQQGQIIDFTWILNNHESGKFYGDVVGKRLIERQPGVVEEGIFAAFKQVVDTGLPQQYEKHYVHEQFDGWFHQSVVKLNDGVVTTTADITPRKTAEQQLQQSRAFLQSVIDSSLDMIQVFKAVHDESGAIVDFVWLMNNQKAVAQNGQVIGKSLLELNPGVVPTGIFDHMVQVAQTGVAYEQEQYYHHEQFDSWFYQALVKTEDGVTMTTRDISRQKQAEEEVLRLKDEVAQKATDKYRTLFNSIDEGFELVELIYNQAGKPIDFLYLETNPAFERQTGLKNVAGKLGKEVSPNIEAYWLDAFDKVVKTGEPIRVEDYNGFTQRWYSSYGFRVGNENNRVFAVLFNDITERKQREGQQQFLIRFSDALRAEPNADAIANRAIQLLAEHLQLDRCYVGIALIDDNRGIFPYQFGNEKVPLMPAEGVALLDFPDAFRTTFDQTLVITDFQHIDGLTQTEKQAFAALGFGALVVANARKEGHKPDLSINAVSAIPRRWTPVEIELIEEVTERTWAALERAKAEEAVQKSEEKYRTLFESIDEGFCVLEMLYEEGGQPRDCRYLQVNPAFLKQTGQVDPTGQLGSDYVPDSASMWLATYDAVVRSGESVRFEQFHPDSGRWYSVHASVIGERGSRLVASVFADITERKQAEQRQEFLLSLSDALRVTESAEETGALAMRLVAQQLSLDRCWVCRFSKEQGLAWLGPEYCLPELPPMSGEYSLGDFPETMRQVETSSPAIDDVRNDPGLSELDRRSILGLGMGAYMTTILRRGEQGYFWALCASTSGPRWWTQSERQLLNEVTERVWAAIERARAEEALRASQKRFESIANLVPDLLWDSQPDGTTSWYNQRWLDYTKQRFEEAIGWGWVDAIHPDDRDAAAKGHQEAVAAGTSLRQEHRIRRYDGAYHWFVVSASPLKDEAGHVVKMYGAATDIDDLKRLEASLREANRRKDEFLAMLAHELRNPMSTLHNTLLLLELTQGQDETLPLDRALAMMSREVIHLNRMVDDLLDVGRISQGKIQVKKQRLDLTKLLRDALEAARPQFSSQGHGLTSQLPDQPIWVDGDQTRLTQVIRNLVTNAAKYTPPGGQITVALGKQDRQAVLRIRDTGIGIAADQLEAIFEVFVQVSSSLDRPQGGLGLGLAVVKQLVELHGGQVGVQSAGLGEGSEFTVRLPLLPEAPASRASTGDGQGVAQKVWRILVVDDNADLALATVMLLRIKKYEAYTCLSGTEALTVVTSLQPDAVLLDLGMPGIDGYETCRRLRELDWGQHGVIVALSGYGQEDDKKRTGEAGFDGHLAKPLNLQTLTAFLDTLLSRTRSD